MEPLDDLLGPDTDYDEFEDAAPSTFDIVRAARVLSVSRRTLDRAILALPAHRRPNQLPTRGKGERTRYVWPDEESLRAWWASATAAPPAAAPKRPRARPAPVVDDSPVDWAAVIRSRR